MKKYLVIAITAASCLGLVGCGSDSGGDNGLVVSNESQSLSYDFTVNGCKTGKHTFSSVEAYCAGLENESLNNGCARQIRCETFKARCDSSVNCD